METLLKKILIKLDNLDSRMENLKKDMDFIKSEATSNNVSIKGIEKLTEEAADKIFNIYDDVKDIKKYTK